MELELSNTNSFTDYKESYIKKTKFLKKYKSDLKLLEDKWLELATIKENLLKKI